MIMTMTSTVAGVQGTGTTQNSTISLSGNLVNNSDKVAERQVRNNYVVSRHEVGHFLALLATGVYNEFKSMNVKPENGLYGVTHRSGESLLAFSQLIVNALGNGTLDQFRADKATQLKYVLPQICYFLGGGAIDNHFGCESDTRNSIDVKELKNLLTALFVTDVNENDVADLKKMVYPFLSGVVDKYSTIFECLTDGLSNKEFLSKEDTDSILGEWISSNNNLNVDKEYAELLKKATIWLEKRLS